MRQKKEEWETVSDQRGIQAEEVAESWKIVDAVNGGQYALVRFSLILDPDNAVLNRGFSTA